MPIIMNTEPLASIVISVYNGEQYVPACMKNMSAQSYSNLEIIVVDDGSKDNTGKLCDEYAEKDKRIKVIHQKNAGLSGARNTGINHATGKYILFVDVDDTIEPDTIADNVALAEKHQADVVMFCFWYYDVDHNKRIPNMMDEIFVGTDEEYFHQMLVPTIDNEIFKAPWNKLIRREVLLDNNIRFDQTVRIYEDSTFAPLLLGNSKKIVINNQMYYTYFYKTSGSLIHNFHENFPDIIAAYYKNAMDYCAKYKDNSKQIRQLNTLYCNLLVLHFKQISCRKGLAGHRKKELLNKIAHNPYFNQALANSKLPVRKQIMCCLVKHKMHGLCIASYQFLNKCQGIRA